MQRVLTVLVMLMMIFSLSLDNSIAADKAKDKKENTKTSQQKQTPRKKELVEKYDLNPVDLARTMLPKNYMGHDLKSIYEALKKREKTAEKGEYETTEQYKQRIQDDGRKPLIGKLTVDDLFSFVVNTGAPIKIPGGGSLYRKILVSNKYDADSQTLILMLRTTREAFNDNADYLDIDNKKIRVDEVRIRGPELYYNESTYIGSNAYGASTAVRRIIWKSIELQFSSTSALPLVYEDEGGHNISYIPWIKLDLKNITPEAAKAIRENLCIAFFYKLKEPYVSIETGRATPHIDFPFDISIATPRVLALSKEIWVFNKTNGEILLKVKTEDVKSED